jgi:hypothetical protein
MSGISASCQGIYLQELHLCIAAVGNVSELRISATNENFLEDPLKIDKYDYDFVVRKLAYVYALTIQKVPDLFARHNGLIAAVDSRRLTQGYSISRGLTLSSRGWVVVDVSVVVQPNKAPILMHEIAHTIFHEAQMSKKYYELYATTSRIYAKQSLDVRYGPVLYNYRQGRPTARDRPYMSYDVGEFFCLCVQAWFNAVPLEHMAGHFQLRNRMDLYALYPEMAELLSQYFVPYSYDDAEINAEARKWHPRWLKRRNDVEEASNSSWYDLVQNLLNTIDNIAIPRHIRPHVLLGSTIAAVGGALSSHRARRRTSGGPKTHNDKLKND